MNNTNLNRKTSGGGSSLSAPTNAVESANEAASTPKQSTTTMLGLARAGNAIKQFIDEEEGNEEEDADECFSRFAPYDDKKEDDAPHPTPFLLEYAESTSTTSISFKVAGKNRDWVSMHARWLLKEGRENDKRK